MSLSRTRVTFIVACNAAVFVCYMNSLRCYCTRGVCTRCYSCTLGTRRSYSCAFTRSTHSLDYVSNTAMSSPRTAASCASRVVTPTLLRSLIPCVIVSLQLCCTHATVLRIEMSVNMCLLSSNQVPRGLQRKPNLPPPYRLPWTR